MTGSKNDTLLLTTTTTKTTNNRPAIERNFMGGYVYLIKNITKHHQVAIRADYYDPNTKLVSSKIGVSGWDAAVKTTTVPGKTTFTGSGPVIANTAVTQTVVSNKLTSGTADIKYQTLTLSYTYFFDDNVKIMLGYEIPMNAKIGVNSKGAGNITSTSTVNGVPVVWDYSKAINQNTLTLRLQVKF